MIPDGDIYYDSYHDTSENKKAVLPARSNIEKWTDCFLAVFYDLLASCSTRSKRKRQSFQGDFTFFKRSFLSLLSGMVCSD